MGTHYSTFRGKQKYATDLLVSWLLKQLRAEHRLVIAAVSEEFYYKTFRLLSQML